MATLLYMYVEELVLVKGGKGLVDTVQFAGLTTANLCENTGEIPTLLQPFGQNIAVPISPISLYTCTYADRQGGRG